MSNINTKNVISNTNSIGITSQTVSDIVTYVDNNKKEKVISLLNKIHPADTADVLEMLSEEYRKNVKLFLKRVWNLEISPSAFQRKFDREDRRRYRHNGPFQV